MLVIVIQGEEALVVPPLYVRDFLVEKDYLALYAVNLTGNAETGEIGEFSLSHSNAGDGRVLQFLNADILY